MQDLPNTHQLNLIELLSEATDAVADELHRGLEKEGFGDIRRGHGCVFGTIRPEEGSRLTELAERAGYTKQAVGEVVTDLEELGYVERVPDPADRRAKIVQLTERGRIAHAAGTRLLAAIESEWAERIGEERVATLRAVLEEALVPAALPVEV